MAMETLIYRLTKGSPLTAQEMDDNLQILYDGVNALESVMGVALNADGTLKANSVATASIQNRAVTQGKLALNHAFVATATYVDPTYSIDFTPAIVDALAHGAGSGAAFYFIADASNASSPTNLKVGTNAALPLKKFNGADVAIGDIRAGDVCLAIYNGTDFCVLTPARPAVHTITSLESPGNGTPLPTVGAPPATAAIAALSLAMPAGCTTWAWIRLMFSGEIDNITTHHGSIGRFSVTCGGAPVAWIDNEPPASGIYSSGWIAPFTSGYWQQFVYITEGEPTGHLSDNPLAIGVTAGVVSGIVGGYATDVVNSRKFLLVGYAI